MVSARAGLGDEDELLTDRPRVVSIAALAFPRPLLTDADLLLRPWSAADVPENVMGFADPSVLRYSWQLTRRYTDADARAFFVEQEQARRRGEELHFAFVRADRTEVVLGAGSLYGVDRTAGRAAVGYWLTPDGRGHGIATRATRLMAAWAFDELGIHRLELTCGPDNDASQRVANRCGFVREGVLRSHLPFKGQRRDTVIYSLLSSDAR
jgi:RimJ/RimL family protein N-acetyltransferase